MVIKKKIPSAKVVAQTLGKLRGKRCWYVSCGANTGSSFKLCLGKMVRREKPLTNKTHPIVFQNNHPEYGLLIWCDWRLSRGGQVIVTSDDCDNNNKWCRSLRLLSGTKIRRTKTAAPFFDLTIVFEKNWQLDVFCDYGNKEPSMDANWQLFVPGNILFGV